MKVICVKSFNKTKHVNAPKPLIGDIDEVSKVIYNGGVAFYKLVRFGNEWGYMADHFAELDSNIDEIELVNERVEATA